MKTKFIHFLLFIFFFESAIVAQETTLTFKGENQYGNYLKVDMVNVLNNTQLWQQILYYPDTVLRLTETGIENNTAVEEGFKLFQNTPNPFYGTTDLRLQIAEPGNVALEIVDLNGKQIVRYEHFLEKGTHSFKAQLSTPQCYLLGAHTDKNKLSIKMVNLGDAGENKLEYVGQTDNMAELAWNGQETKSAQYLPVGYGDSLTCMGYRFIYGDTFASRKLSKMVDGSEDINLKFDIALPTVTTYPIGIVHGNHAYSGGDVIDAGGDIISARGVCWNTMPNPTVDDDYTTDGCDLGVFTSCMTGLSPNTSYYVRSYAMNSAGIAYGDQTSFTTHSIPNVVTASQVLNVTTNSATCGGTVTSDEGVTVTSYGVCCSTSPNPTLNNYHTVDGAGTGSFTSDLQGLLQNTTYYVRAYAISNEGTAYGNQITFTTLPLSLSLPTVVTSSSVVNVTSNSATCGGNVLSDGGASVTSHGVCWSTSQNPTLSDSYTVDGAGTGNFTSLLSGLTANTTYYVRAYATNSVGTAYGEQFSFSTHPIVLPIVVTSSSVVNVTTNSATCGGTVTSDGGTIVTARGVCWSISPNPTISDNHTSDGSGTGSFTSQLTDLIPNTTYFVRAYATNSEDTVYGTQLSFSTLNADGLPCPNTATVTDIDGNTYNTVHIGQQCWMKENLRTTHYADGTSIPMGSTSFDTMAYRYYPNNDSSNVVSHGYLYNWQAVMGNSSSSSSNPSGVLGVCPAGWHVPSSAEWTQLTNYVSSQSQYVCGSDSSSIAKALASNIGWRSSTNTCAIGNTPGNNNATGFSAVPAGYYYGGSYGDFGFDAYFWSSTESSSNTAYSRTLGYYTANVNSYNSNKSSGYSVRCLRD